MDKKSKVGFEEPGFVDINVKDKPSNMEVMYFCAWTKAGKLMSSIVSAPSCQSALAEKIWAVIGAIMVVILWIFVMQLATLGNGFVWKKHWSASFYSLPPERVYENNGYLIVSCNGGLNQMRTGICDMVAIARYMNVTLIVPELDNTSYWHDRSLFQEIYDEDHFITSLRNELHILKQLPQEEKRRLGSKSIYSINPISWSQLSYYNQKILPKIKKHKVLHFLQADARLANNGLPIELQKLRCKANYEALRFTAQIEETGRKIVRILRQKGPFLVLHLRFEKDILSFTGCTEGLTHKEIVELINMRESYPWWKARSNPKKRRKSGGCPLTPDETALALRALGIDHNIQIYIASGNIYGGESRMARLAEAFPNLVKKETLLDPSDLRPFLNHSNQMAALDYIVSVESDIFVPTYEGNMAKAVEGHRRYLGFRTTIMINKRLLVSLVDQYKIGRVSWDEFSFIMKAAHADHMGKPRKRLKIRGHPREEDYFYSNPQECMPEEVKI